MTLHLGRHWKRPGANQHGRTSRIRQSDPVPCTHRGTVSGEVSCCGSPAVFACAVHGKCVLTKPHWDAARRAAADVHTKPPKCCELCKDRVHQESPKVPAAVIITCHNYGRFLGECLQSIEAQTIRPETILVVDDSSTDETPEIAAEWSARGVRYLHVDVRNVRLARLAGLRATSSEFVCFLDADDILSADYLESGIAAISCDSVGFAYSDRQRFGARDVYVAAPERVDSAGMSRTNYVHVGAVARREALEMSRALDVAVDPQQAHEDWAMWRRVLDQGWSCRKQSGVYWHRHHADGASVLKMVDSSYFDLRALQLETVTLFVPLSGRTAIWPRFQQWLEQQQWPRDQVRLIVMDTSQDARFGRRIRRWLAGCEYSDTRYIAEAVAEPGLADEDRRSPGVADRVRMAAARIYNRLAREVSGAFTLIVEDDVIPPLDAVDLLLRGFEADTASVAGPYLSRFHQGYVAWQRGRQIITERGVGTEAVEGNGFGCTMFRTEVLRGAVFTARQKPYADFDPAFYGRLQSTGMTAKLCWSAECQHLENKTTPIMTWEHWPESFELQDLTDYRAGVLTGRPACQWIVDTLRGPEPAAIWGLSDGDVSWWCHTALSAVPGIDPHWLDALSYTSGLFNSADTRVLWPLFDAACRSATAWLVQYDWDIAERVTLAALTAQGVTIRPDGFEYSGDIKQKVDCNAVYRLIDEGLWWPLLQNRRLAIVGGYAEQLAAKLMDADYVREFGGGDITWSIATTLTCPPKSSPKRETWEEFQRSAFTTDWDLLLCSAGSLSSVLCESARLNGRSALDIGATDVRLLQLERFAP